MGWLLGSAWLFWAGAITSAPFFGEQPSPAELADSRRLMGAAAIVALVLPVLGLIGGLRLRSRVAVVVFAVLLVIGAAFGLVLVVDAFRH